MAAYEGDQWANLMSKLYHDFEQTESLESKLTLFFSNLSQTLEKKSLLYWHIKSFENYSTENLNPFGLRVQIFPSFDNIDASFKAVW